MKKKIAVIIIELTITMAGPAFAEMNHSMHNMGHEIK